MSEILYRLTLTAVQAIDNFYSVLGDAGGYSCWDTGRGIYHNKDKTFLTWLNEEDHFRFISMQKGGNLGQVYKRLVSVSLFDLMIF